MNDDAVLVFVSEICQRAAVKQGVPIESCLAYEHFGGQQV